MSIYGNSAEDRHFANELDKHLDGYVDDTKRDVAIEERAKDKFMALPDMYTSRDGVKRYTNMEDAIGSIKQEEFVAVARALRDGDYEEAGRKLADALWRICSDEAEYEVDDES